MRIGSSAATVFGTSSVFDPPTLSVDGGGDTTGGLESASKVLSPRPLAPPVPSTDGGGGTADTPEPPGKPPRPGPASLPAPLTDGGGGTAAMADPNESVRPPARVAASPTDGGGGTTTNAPVPLSPAGDAPEIVPWPSAGNFGAGAT